MADEQWIPRSKRGDAVATAEFLEFVPGLEGRRKAIVVEWLLKRGRVNVDLGYPQPCTLAIRFLDAYNPHWEGKGSMEMLPGSWRREFMEFGEETLLDFLDYALHDISTRTTDRNEAANLDRALLNAHSIFTVGEYEGRCCVIERVDPTVQAVVKEAAEESGTAGQYLGRAWGQAYAVHPDPTGAYGNAVRAVETLLCPIVEPDAPKPTLGTSSRVLHDQHGSPKSTWTFKIDSKIDPEQPVRDVVAMMTMLWNGQMDRHGGDETKTRPVTLDEARSAVLLAATLVGWLNADYLEKK